MGLWDVLRTDSDAQNIANVEWLVNYAEGKLLLIRETFPDYTRHDARHSENVIALAEKLLGPAIEHLRPLEAAMLILAAYFHDIGMAYDPGELAALAEEQDFRDFLNENPAAYVQVHEAEEVPLDVLVQYARTIHADRATELLFLLPASKRTWEGVGFTEELGTMCRSHMQPLEELRSSKFPSDFRDACDLRMCAIVLRLADILDLDDTRAPAAIYSHLRLSGEAEGPRAVSNTEWSKHIVSRGFRFPETRNPSYPLRFLASPQRPSVEHSVRKFLDAVEDELRGCRILLDFCDQRWRTLVIPGSIDRTGIVSDGYHYGEYRFSLDRHEVLRLFMGDKLYSDPYTFIRELLQNAIDACRLNCYLHDADPATMEVRVSAWEDEAGNYWFRVDDTGIGMDQEIVEKYFLGVGRSYYRSEELQADILRKNKPQQHFVAISRFGIGALSSFIVGDRIEISSRRRLADGRLATPLRLSLDSLEDYFVMQDHPIPANPLLGRNGEEPGYRKNAGTSVAVRIDPTKSDVSLEELIERARKSIFFPPVRAYINDVEQRSCGYSRLDIPFLEAPLRHSITYQSNSGHSFCLLAASELSVLIIPLNLTANSPSQNIRGQLIAARAETTGSANLLPALPKELRSIIPDSLTKELANCIIGRNALVMANDSRYRLNVTLELDCKLEVIQSFINWLESLPRKNKYQELASRLYENMNDHIDDELGQVSISESYDIDCFQIFGDNKPPLVVDNWLGHNGISVSTRPETASASYYEGSLKLLNSRNFIIVGPVCMFDELRPDVSVSRDSLRSFPFAIRSALQLAVRRAASVHLTSPEKDFASEIMQSDLITNMPLTGLTIGQIDTDPLMPEWRTENIIQLDSKKVNVEEARFLANSGPHTLNMPLRTSRSFYSALRAAITEIGLDIELPEMQIAQPTSSSISLMIRTAERPARPPGLSVLPPFTAVRYKPSEIIIAPLLPANLQNPIIAWFADQASFLNSEYPALFAQFRRALIKARTSRYSEYSDINLENTRHAEKLLNSTLLRIRRSIPGTPAALDQAIYSDSSGRLWSR